MTLKTGRVGNCFWAFNAGTVFPEDHQRLLEQVRLFCAAAAPRTTVLHMLHDAPRPSAVERQELGAALNAAPSLTHVLGHALVTNSALTRGALTAINWLLKAPIPQTTFATPDAGMEWLASLDPSLDVQALKAAILLACPESTRVIW